MKKRELTPQDEVMNEWLNRNKGGLITFALLVISGIIFIAYLMFSNSDHYKGGCDKPKTENTKIK